MKHDDSKYCPSCEEKLKQAHQYLKDWFHDMKEKFPTIHIAWSYRGKEAQELAVSEGKSKLHYPKSKHNHCDKDGNPCSLALDLFQLINNQAVFDKLFLSQLAAICKKDQLDILWAGTWTGISDFDHFEYFEKS